MADEEIIDLGELAQAAEESAESDIREFVREQQQAPPIPNVPVPGGNVQLVEYPATVITSEFVLEIGEIGAWGYHPFGIIATGNYKDAEDEVNVIVPYDRIIAIEINYQLYEELVEDAENEEVEDEGPSD